MPFCNLRFFSHDNSIYSPRERHTQQFQETSALLIRLRRSNDRYFQPPYFVDLIIFDLREDRLFPEGQSIISPAVETNSEDTPGTP